MLTRVVEQLSLKLEKKALPSEDFEPQERALIRKLLPQIEEMLEERRRAKWLRKSIGIFFFGIPSATVAIYQLGKALVEWIRGP